MLFHTGDPSILEALRRVALEGERALARAAPREGPDVLERLDPDKQPARAIADALAGLAPSLLDDPAVRARVRRIALGPGDRSVRRAALQRLAESPGPEETALFERMLEEEPDGPVRLAAMRALSESRAATAAELEIRVLQDPYEQFTLRSFGAIGLGLHAGHPGATRALAEAFWGDPSEAVRRSALRSLITQARTSLDAQRAVARVLAEATDPELRRMAASGLEVGAARGLSRSALEGALVAEACKEVRSECRGVLARMN